MMTFMTTTIQISEEVRKKLFQLMNRMEKELGRRVSYNEAIQSLLGEEDRKPDKKQFLKNLEPYFGILKPGEGIQYLKELRQLEYERDKRFNRD